MSENYSENSGLKAFVLILVIAFSVAALGSAFLMEENITYHYLIEDGKSERELTLNFSYAPDFKFFTSNSSYLNSSQLDFTNSLFSAYLNSANVTDNCALECSLMNNYRVDINIKNKYPYESLNLTAFGCGNFTTSLNPNECYNSTFVYTDENPPTLNVAHNLVVLNYINIFNATMSLTINSIEYMYELENMPILDV